MPTAASTPIWTNICAAYAIREMPAMRSALEQLQGLDFADQKTLVPEFDRLFKQLTAEQTEYWDKISKPKASRRLALAKEYMDTTAALLDNLDKISGNLSAAVNHADPTIDQLLQIKQMAWLLRNTAGEASLQVSNALNAGKMNADIQQTYIKNAGGTEIAWNALQLAAAGMQLPPKLADAIAATKTAYFDPQYTGLRDRLVKAALAGEKTELTVNQWTPRHGRAARRRGWRRRSRTRRGQGLRRDTAVFCDARARQFSSHCSPLLLRSRSARRSWFAHRVINPLRRISDATLKLAAGDLSVSTDFSARNDEIGVLAGAMATFKQNAVEKSQVRAGGAGPRRPARSGRRRSTATSRRSRAKFATRSARSGKASEQMHARPQHVDDVRPDQRERAMAAQASGEASVNVQSVASATEELSASINDISRQVARAAETAGRAVDQARQTDDTVQGAVANRRPHRRGREHDQRHRRPDQPAGAERHHRGGTRR